MQVAELELYEILKNKLGEKEAKSIIEYVEAKVEKKLEEKKDIFATKEDVNNLRETLKEEINKLRIEIEKTRADLIKWMFLFWIGQLASLIAILQIFFRK
jgi:hypothetical protein